MLTLPHIKERLSFAYVGAVASTVGVGLAEPRVHDYGVDGSFQSIVKFGRHLTESGFPVDFQLKATVRWKLDGDSIAYDMEAPAYNKLITRHPRAVPYVLILMCLPRQEPEWMAQDEDGLLLRNCCYWMHFPPAQPTENVSSISPQLPPP